ncbi:MAG TPA: hypothetical protein VFA50_18680 [Stellaceae bacterium]|nr:hypothetical protein [Stellaceae bacterium]
MWHRWMRRWDGRYSARRAIAAWLLLSAAAWMAVAGLIAIAYDWKGTSLETEADRLSKIAPAAGGAPAQ